MSTQQAGKLDQKGVMLFSWVIKRYPGGKQSEEHQKDVAPNPAKKSEKERLSGMMPKASIVLSQSFGSKVEI